MSQQSAIGAMQGPADKIGRYFSVLAVVPSVLLVLYTQVLIESQPWSGQPDWSRGLKGTSSGGIANAVQILLISLLIGLALHPLQYILVQLCEGYWGTSTFAASLMAHKIRRHRQRYVHLTSLSDTALGCLEDAGESPEDETHSAVSLDNLRALSLYEESERLLLEYPSGTNNIRPTRLGNVLRRYEAQAGSQYGISLVTIAPHLALISKPEHISYLNDQRTTLDLAIRMVVINVLATVVSIALLWRCGLWLAVALVPYTFAYLFYRGSVVVAAEYGTALTVVLELNRFKLYEELHLPLPRNTRVEIGLNERLMKLLSRDEDEEESEIPSLAYYFSQFPPDTPGQARQ